jgi:menaquinone-9 beta-reductase
MREFDVAVIGAGPAGSSAAITLAQQGYHVALIDRAVFPRDKLCGDFVNPINWPVLQELNVGQDLLARPHTKVSRFRMTTAGGAEIITALPVQGEPQFGLGLRRFHMDHVLLERARRAGVSVHEGVKVKAVEKDSRGWRLDLDRRGDPFLAWTKLLVGADGRNSWVARHLGVAAEPSMRSGSVGFEIQLQKVRGVRGSVEIHQFVGGYGGVVRVDEGTINLCFTVQRKLLGRSVSFENLRERFLRHNPFLDELLRASEPVSTLRSVSPVFFPARRCFGDGFLLVGDAARVTEPLTGEGMFFALRSGQLAATTVAAALREGNLSLPRLSQFDRACRAEFGSRLRLNSLIRKLVYRPRLLSLAIPLLSSQKRLLDRLVSAVCLRRAAFDSKLTSPLKAFAESWSFKKGDSIHIGHRGGQPRL